MSIGSEPIDIPLQVKMPGIKQSLDLLVVLLNYQVKNQIDKMVNKRVRYQIQLEILYLCNVLGLWQLQMNLINLWFGDSRRTYGKDIINNQDIVDGYKLSSIENMTSLMVARDVDNKKHDEYNEVENKLMYFVIEGLESMVNSGHESYLVHEKDVVKRMMNILWELRNVLLGKAKLSHDYYCYYYYIGVFYLLRKQNSLSHLIFAHFFFAVVFFFAFFFCFFCYFVSWLSVFRGGGEGEGE